MSQQTETQAIDPIQFRNALGQFATGVTVITTVDKAGNKVGLTANSFSSVSLEPPLVLWSLAKNALSLPVFEEVDHFAIHVLTSEQMVISNQFASKGSDKFAGIDIENGIADMPLLTEYSARFQCRKTYEYEGGDHIIFVGEVIDYDQGTKPPLLFHSGRYAEKKQETAPFKGSDDGSFNADFLMYLVEHVTAQVTHPFHQAVIEKGISVTAMHILALLSVGDGRSIANLKALNPLEDELKLEAEIQCLNEQHYIAISEEGGVPRLLLRDSGQQLIVELLAIGKACELDALDCLDDDEQRQLKNLLRRVIDKNAMGIPDPFVVD